MSIKGLNYISFGNHTKSAFLPDYSYREFSESSDINQKLNILYAKSLELEENQRTITQNQKAMQDTNYKAFRSFYINNPNGFDCVKIDSAFNNKINLVV